MMDLPVLSLVLILLVGCPIAFSLVDLSLTEKTVLYNIYTSLQGELWVWKTPVSTYGSPWKFTTDADIDTVTPCNSKWQGITCICTSLSCSVNEITLSRLGLNGSLPSTLNQLVDLNSIIMDNNCIADEIPSSLFELTKLTYVDLSYNMLTSSIPSTIGTGSIVSEEESTLHTLILHENYLNGFIPISLYDIKTLSVLVLSGNLIDGSIAYEICNLSQLMVLDVSNNYLTGTIPIAVRNLTMLQYLYMSDNYFDGSIPQVFKQLPLLTHVNLGNNLLHSSIPVGIAICKQLKLLGLQHNYLTGTVPSLYALKELTEVFLQNNLLQGQLASIVSTINNTHLETIDISSNNFYGKVPMSWFDLPYLQTLDTSANCLTAEFDTSVCHATNLHSLIMNGINVMCQTYYPFRIVDKISSLKLGIVKNIPDCIYALPSLTSLQLSCNGIASILPTGVIIGSNLSTLHLSYNQIKGVIPIEFQSHAWHSFDLSHNKLSGFLYSIMNVSEALSLQVNRLSGDIPISLYSTTTAELLDGNMFQCNINQVNGLSGGSRMTNNRCGSDNTNNSIYAWFYSLLVCLGVSSFVLIVMRNDFSVIRKHVNIIFYIDNMKTDDGVKYNNMSCTDNIKSFNRLLGRMRYFITIATAVILFCYLPTFTVLQTYYRMYRNDYIWYASALYLTGEIPAIIILLLIVLSIFVCGKYLRHVINIVTLHSSYRSHKLSIKNKDALLTLSLEEIALRESKQPINRRRRYLILLFAALLNFTIVVAFNSAYVYVLIHSSATGIFLSQILLAIVKLSWTNFVIIWIVDALENYFLHDALFKKQNDAFLIFLSIFTNVVGPSIVMAVTNTKCFYDIIFSHYYISNSFEYLRCLLLLSIATTTTTDTCIVHTSIQSSASFSSPFVYSYECSSTIISAYTSVFVYSGILLGFFLPVMMFLLLIYRDSVYAPTNVLVKKLLNEVFPLLLRPEVAKLWKSMSTKTARQLVKRLSNAHNIELHDLANSVNRNISDKSQKMAVSMLLDDDDDDEDAHDDDGKDTTTVTTAAPTVTAGVASTAVTTESSPSSISISISDVAVTENPLLKMSMAKRASMKQDFVEAFASVSDGNSDHKEMSSDAGDGVAYRDSTSISRKIHSLRNSAMAATQSQVLSIYKIAGELATKTAFFDNLDTLKHAYINTIDKETHLFRRESFLLRLLSSISVLFTFGLVFPPLSFIMCVVIACQTYFIQYQLGYFLTHTIDCSVDHTTGQEVNYPVHALNQQLVRMEIYFYESLWQLVPYIMSFITYLLFDILGDDVGLSRAINLVIPMLLLSLLLYGLPIIYRIYERVTNKRRQLSRTGSTLQMQPSQKNLLSGSSSSSRDANVVGIRRDGSFHPNSLPVHLSSRDSATITATTDAVNSRQQVYTLRKHISYRSTRSIDKPMHEREDELDVQNIYRCSDDVTFMNSGSGSADVTPAASADGDDADITVVVESEDDRPSVYAWTTDSVSI